MAQYRMGFVIEHALGHITHGQWLRKFVAADESVDPEFMQVDPFVPDPIRRLPRMKYNWNVVGSVRARQRIRAAYWGGPLDSLLIHTQVMAFLAGGIMRRIPTVLSLDATPIMIDQLGGAYQHAADKNKGIINFKIRVNRRMFNAAARLVSLNHLTKRSLVNDYGVAAEKVEVIPPGIDLEQWKTGRTEREPGPIRLLFVGGSFTRKGGEAVVEAFRRMAPGLCALDIVTKLETGYRAELTAGVQGVRTHFNLRPNAPELIGLFRRADIFVFPTLGDFTPWVILEAMAMELPVISTNVGAVDEEVLDGVNGSLVKLNDIDCLVAKIREMAQNPAMRREMGIAARKHVDAEFNAHKNYPKLISLMKRIADEKRAGKASGAL